MLWQGHRVAGIIPPILQRALDCALLVPACGHECTVKLHAEGHVLAARQQIVGSFAANLPPVLRGVEEHRLRRRFRCVMAARVGKGGGGGCISGEEEGVEAERAARRATPGARRPPSIKGLWKRDSFEKSSRRKGA